MSKITTYLEKLKAIEAKATPGQWRVANAIDPNPIFLETWGPNYKTMWWVVAGHGFGEGGNSPTQSTLTNITPKETLMSERDVRFIAISRTALPLLIAMNERLLEAVKEIAELMPIHERDRRDIVRMALEDIEKMVEKE